MNKVWIGVIVVLLILAFLVFFGPLGSLFS
ncbi:hypothetical protein SAMN05421852_11395 [Thermoflavimicrobium dichotomicum]|uniref:Uncharacterized protein n=1 Tax=Thermoflavimicrobium dichotomicum TaxID=46223 RepID=A0A1I3SQ43_9BACL|nr:hypothetical protein SAMN05421852_11395 [Thermoflavimicrobium dichotomicum]